MYLLMLCGGLSRYDYPAMITTLWIALVFELLNLIKNNKLFTLISVCAIGYALYCYNNQINESFVTIMAWIEFGLMGLGVFLAGIALNVVGDPDTKSKIAVIMFIALSSFIVMGVCNILYPVSYISV